MSKVFVTGGAGFIGSAFCRLAKASGYAITAFDALTYAGDRANLEGVCPLIVGDISQFDEVESALAKVKPDIVVNFAAETHVDRAIDNTYPFLDTNVRGVQTLIDACRKLWPLSPRLYVQVSTDEVYGPILEGYAVEASPLRPGNGYSASKAAADLLVLAAFNTWGFPGVVTRCVNNYGPRQHPEKLIPKVVTLALQDKSIPVFTLGDQVRDWIHVDDHCRAILKVIERSSRRIYNIAAHEERRNLDVVKTILRILGKPDSLIEMVANRPGHDRRYGITNTRLQWLGWSPGSFDLRSTVQWYVENEAWWRRKVS